MSFLLLPASRCLASAFRRQASSFSPNYPYSAAFVGAMSSHRKMGSQVLSVVAEEFKDFELSDFGETTVQAVLDHKAQVDKGMWLWCTDKDSVRSAIMKMSKANAGALVILDESKTHAVNHAASIRGIFTERDYMKKIILEGKDSATTRVADIMTPHEDMMTICPKTKVMDAMATMVDGHIRHLPVIDNGHMIGFISIRDLVTVLVAEHKKEMEMFSSYVNGSY